jgi:hypothetical protein
MVIAGEISSVLPTIVASGADAAFGGVSGTAVAVTHGTSPPVATVLHPDGNGGAVTPSKF